MTNPVFSRKKYPHTCPVCGVGFLGYLSIKIYIGSGYRDPGEKMKRALDVHEENLLRRKESLVREKGYLDMIASKVKRMEEDYAFLEKQIAEAKRLKKDGFDADKFLVTQK